MTLSVLVEKPALVASWRLPGCGVEGVERLDSEEDGGHPAGHALVEAAPVEVGRVKHGPPTPVLADPGHAVHKALGPLRRPNGAGLARRARRTSRDRPGDRSRFPGSLRETGRHSAAEPWMRSAESVAVGQRVVRVSCFCGCCDDHPDPRHCLLAASLAGDPV